MNLRKGFTFVELIMVVSIIVILAAAIFVGIDPAKRLNETRNDQRIYDVATLIDIIKNYQFND